MLSGGAKEEVDHGGPPLLQRNSRTKLTGRILCDLFFSAIVGASVTQYIFLLGIRYTSATFSCAFINMVPVITFIMALPFGLETLNIRCKAGRAKMIGTVVCVGGAMLLTLYSGMPLFNNSRKPQTVMQTVNEAIRMGGVKRKEKWTIGSMALLAGVLLWSSWFLIQSNLGKRYPYHYSSTAIMSLFGAIQSSILSFCIDRSLSTWVLKGKTEILTVVYSGVVGSGFSYVGMSWCLKKRGPVFTAAFNPLILIIAALIDIPILHGQLHLGSLLGSITVIAGLYILLWGKNKEAQSWEAKITQDAEEVKPQEQPPLQVIAIASDSPCP